ELMKEKATNEEIADFLERKGESIANKGNEIAKIYANAFQEIYKTTDGSQASLNKTRDAIDSLASAIDSDFYKHKSIERLNKELSELAKISYEIRTEGSGSIEEYVKQIEALGYTTDEAIVIVGNLAKENENAVLFQQALAQGFE